MLQAPEFLPLEPSMQLSVKLPVKVVPELGKAVPSSGGVAIDFQSSSSILAGIR